MTEALITNANRFPLIPDGIKKLGVSPATGFRYILDGKQGVKLASVKIGRTRYTSDAAIDRFIAQLAEASQAVEPATA
ncbi:MAG: DUF1580 domain-containing protein [Planctomycetota bacterium]